MDFEVISIDVNNYDKCDNCGGNLVYVEATNSRICDICGYEEEEV